MSGTEHTNNKRSNQRRFLDKFIELPVKLLIKHKISPTILSYIGFLCSVSVAFLLSIGGLHFPFCIAWIVPFILFWAGAFDVFDGEVARRTNLNSKAGAFLDSNLDRLSDAALIIGLILGNFLHYILGYIILFLIIMISYIRARAENEGIDMKGVGFMERADRLIILWFAFIAEFWIYYLSKLILGTPFTLFFPIFILFFTGLLILTIVQRLIFSFKALNKLDEQNKK
ncbi:Phosphatidylinositol phosphate synthase [subsurface metagenome]